MQIHQLAKKLMLMETTFAFHLYETCDNSGKIVTPACPPTTGTSTSLGSRPRTSACTKLKEVKSW